jgi:hypothetical protein
MPGKMLPVGGAAASQSVPRVDTLNGSRPRVVLSKMACAGNGSRIAEAEGEVEDGRGDDHIARRRLHRYCNRNQNGLAVGAFGRGDRHLFAVGSDDQRGTVDRGADNQRGLSRGGGHRQPGSRRRIYGKADGRAAGRATERVCAAVGEPDPWTKVKESDAGVTLMAGAAMAELTHPAEASQKTAIQRTNSPSARWLAAARSVNLSSSGKTA